MNLSLPRSQRAFSLIEVTLALGIVAFGFVTLMAMLPLTLETSREAMERTHASRITQRLIVMVQQTPFEQQGVLVGQRFRFDSDGELVEDTDPNFVYSATIIEPARGSTSATLFNDTSLGVSRDTNRMLAVRINKYKDVDLNPASSADSERYFFQIAFSTSDMRL